MKQKIFCIAILLALMQDAAKAETSSTSGAQAQSGMNADACAQYDQADHKLNEIYQSILKDKYYTADTVFVDALKAAQRQWIKYRDAEVEALFPGVDKKAKYGSAYPMCSCAASAKLTRQRIQDLQAWTDGISEGDICSGSVKEKI